MELGNKVFYNLQDGVVIYQTGDMQGDFPVLTIDEIIKGTVPLKDLDRNTFEVIEFDFGAHREQRSLGGYIKRIDLETLTPIFGYIKSDGLTEETILNPYDRIEQLEKENTTIKASMAELAELVLSGGM